MPAPDGARDQPPALLNSHTLPLLLSGGQIPSPILFPMGRPKLYEKAVVESGEAPCILDTCCLLLSSYSHRSPRRFSWALKKAELKVESVVLGVYL